MITLKRQNVVRYAATEEKAALLERQGFHRVDGGAEEPSSRPATMEDLSKAADEIYERLKETVTKMGEAMFERLSNDMRELVANTAAPEKPRAAKGSKKEGPDGGAAQPDRTDGTK